MFRGLLSSRLIQVGLVFFVVVVSGSLLYSWQTRRATVAEFTRADVVPHETRSEQDTVDTSTVDFEQTGTSLEADDSQMPDDMDVSPIDETSEMLEMAEAFLPDDFVSEEAPAEDVPVSPYGFGPYPEVPSDFPGTPIWERDSWQHEGALGFSEEHKKNLELLSRVLVKLWVDQGVGSYLGGAVSHDTGLVYPYFENTIYVKRTIGRKPDETEGVAVAEIISPGNLLLTGEEMDRFRETGETPPDLRVLQINTDGIDPYEFLNFQR